jgi:hypothetical protein
MDMTAVECDSDDMWSLRLVLALVLSLTTLPWGAWLGAGIGHARTETATAYHLAEAPVLAGADRALPEDAAVSAPVRHCLGPRLPGSSCSPVFALLPDGTDLPEDREGEVVAGTDSPAVVGWMAEVDLGPPRLG